MKVSVEISDALLQNAIASIMNHYPELQQDGDSNPMMICIECDQANMVYKFYDKMEHKSYVLCEDNLKAAIGKVIVESDWEDIGHERPDVSKIDEWAENLTHTEVNDFIQIACFGTVKYENDSISD